MEAFIILSTSFLMCQFAFFVIGIFIQVLTQTNGIVENMGGTRSRPLLKAAWMSPLLVILFAGAMIWGSLQHPMQLFVGAGFLATLYELNWVYKMKLK